MISYILGNKPTQLVAKNKLILQHPYRFLDPIVHGRYPYSMQEIAKDRLPLFSDEEARMVKGSIDYVGINHYTSFYMKDPGTWNLTPVSYQDDWHVGFVCKFLTPRTKFLNSAVSCAAVTSSSRMLILTCFCRRTKWSSYWHSRKCTARCLQTPKAGKLVCL
jgi:hypothetical protein